MILTEQTIKEAINDGSIIYKLGDESLIKCESIDVRLGRYLYVYDSIEDNEYWVDLDAVDSFVAMPYVHFIIAHTEEFIGTAPYSGLLPTFKLKSSAGRLGVIHTLAGHGEVGYHNRWAMEFITAKPVILKRYMSIGQIYFTKTTEQGGDYSLKGTYQSTSNLEELMDNWNKDSILPPKGLKQVIV